MLLHSCIRLAFLVSLTLRTIPSDFGFFFLWQEQSFHWVDLNCYLIKFQFPLICRLCALAASLKLDGLPKSFRPSGRSKWTKCRIQTERGVIQSAARDVIAACAWSGQRESERWKQKRSRRPNAGTAVGAEGANAFHFQHQQTGRRSPANECAYQFKSQAGETYSHVHPRRDTRAASRRTHAHSRQIAHMISMFRQKALR